MAPSAEEAETARPRTRDELLAERIRVSLGGRAAESLYYGDGGLSTGAANDLAKATDTVREMVAYYGMDKEFGFHVAPERMGYESGLSSAARQKLEERTGNILREEMDKTLKLLEENREHLDAVTNALVEKERLSTKDLQSILPEISSSAGRI